MGLASTQNRSPGGARQLAGAPSPPPKARPLTRVRMRPHDPSAEPASALHPRRRGGARQPCPRPPLPATPAPAASARAPSLSGASGPCRDRPFRLPGRT
ncbi:hypothetical protein NX02_p0095 (plasmid) [Sphingomonas sanxanigenens DSM 19645 = NX02]|uniref:Uncharacterized protein n=1 Tax=Sphingomonas sanxanigenens DSM 19645 = NX02 TaxID=1123269 RepID=A0A0F7JV41_9SPHN|nr:hypothetical protein NX02_p0095 [Sphingomonas sanxanigenens DSM 19645 = NX02]